MFFLAVGVFLPSAPFSGCIQDLQKLHRHVSPTPAAFWIPLPPLPLLPLSLFLAPSQGGGGGYRQGTFYNYSIPTEKRLLWRVLM